MSNFEFWAIKSKLLKTIFPFFSMFTLQIERKVTFFNSVSKCKTDVFETRLTQVSIDFGSVEKNGSVLKNKLSQITLSDFVANIPYVISSTLSNRPLKNLKDIILEFCSI